MSEGTKNIWRQQNSHLLVCIDNKIYKETFAWWSEKKCCLCLKKSIQSSEISFQTEIYNVMIFGAVAGLPHKTPVCLDISKFKQLNENFYSTHS